MTDHTSNLPDRCRTVARSTAARYFDGFISSSEASAEIAQVCNHPLNGCSAYFNAAMAEHERDSQDRPPFARSPEDDAWHRGTRGETL